MRLIALGGLAVTHKYYKFQRGFKHVYSGVMEGGEHCDYSGDYLSGEVVEGRYTCACGKVVKPAGLRYTAPQHNRPKRSKAEQFAWRAAQRTHALERDWQRGGSLYEEHGLGEVAAREYAQAAARMLAARQIGVSVAQWVRWQIAADVGQSNASRRAQA